ncbi:hypothetical protein ES708_15443 [subsurface metagenome]
MNMQNKVSRGSLKNTINYFKLKNKFIQAITLINQKGRVGKTAQKRLTNAERSNKDQVVLQYNKGYAILAI